MSLQPGDRFGRYEILELLGKGGMGEVYSALDTVLHRRVALKVLRVAPGETGGGSGSGNKTDGAARILREARAAAGITHVNAVAIYDVGEVDGAAFLAMELVAGRTLRAFVGNAGIPLERRIRWLVDVVRALGAAHQLGLVHRDIKPENIMVRDDGVVKVLDFGIARRTNVSAADPNSPTEGVAIGTLTADGVVVGTPMYMAPEQMRGERLDGRADQFAWGVLAYELLTGRLPWDTDAGGLQLVAQILTRDVESARERNPAIPPPVDAAIRKAMSKAASDRFASMDDVADEIEPFAAVGGATTARSRERSSLAARERTDVALAPTEHLMSTPPIAPAKNELSTRSQLAAPQAPAVPGGLPRWGVALVASLVLALGALGVRTLASRGAAPITPGRPDAAPAPALESPMSANAEATTEYRAGLRALRDAAVNSAMQHLDHAIELDPGFAAAHLQRALVETIRDVGTTKLRESLRVARDARGSLGEHDHVVLDAMEPWALEPPDLRESLRRFEVAAKDHPSDIEFAFYEGILLDESLQTAKALAQFADVVKRDPTFALAWRMKAREQVLLGDAAGGFAAYDQCLKLSPGARTCLTDLAALEENEGKCADLETTSRRLVSVAPDSDGAYFLLAEALFGEDQSIEAVHAALEQKWDRQPQSSRKASQLANEASLAVVTGDFAGADQRYAERERAAASLPDDLTHFLRMQPRMLIALETGRNADVAKLGEAYLHKRSAWLANSLALDPAIHVYGVELAAGSLTLQAFQSRRDEWLAREAKRSESVGFGGYDGIRWAFAYAEPATTQEQAALALAQMPDAQPLVSPQWMSPDVAEPIGRALALAGRLDAAIPLLERASQSCAFLEDPSGFFSTWAAFDLGGALEGRGDNAGACAAYARVLKRWGSAKPPSRTAAKALARARALGCGR